MNPSRLVSIAIPAYKPDFFETALLSAFSQTHEEIEIVICDDCKDEGIHSIVERLRPLSPWPIRYLRNERPLGEARNAAKCIRESRGEYVKFLYDDDLLRPDCVSQLFALLHDHPEIVLASSRRQIINEQGDLQPDNWATFFPFSHDVIFSGPELVSFLGQFTINFIGEPSCIMCRRDDIAAFGDDLMIINGSSIDWVGDVAIYLKLLRKGNLAMLATPLSYFRVSSLQYSEQGRNTPKIALDSQIVLRQRVNELGWTQSLEDYRMVKVATFGDRHHFTEIDMVPYFATIHPGNHFDFSPSRWMTRRVVTESQQRLIDDHLDANSAGSGLLLVVLDNNQQSRQVVITLQSVLEHQALSDALQVVVLSTTHAPSDFQDGAHLHWRTSPLDRQAAALNSLLEGHGCDWFMLAEAGVTFTPHGLSRLRLKLPELPHAQALYADELHRSSTGRHEPAFRPDFNLDYLLSYPAAMSRHWVFHRQSMLDAGGFNADVPNAIELDLILRLVENGGMAQLQHMAEPLLICDGLLPEQNIDEVRSLNRHLQARGYVDSEVWETATGNYQIRYNHEQRPLVSILIPTKDQLGILTRCVESVLEKTAYSDYEIIIIDNNSEEPDALDWLAGVESMQSDKVRVLRHPFPFNYSEINNAAARNARGDYLVLLNNDTAVLHPEWLDNLLNHALRPEVGIVGAKLYYPDSAIQHAGVVLGIDAPALHVFLGSPQDSSGYMQRLKVDQDYSVVTAACLMIRKSLYEQVEGLDEVNFKVSYNDVDLCLKVRESGHLVVWTPHVQLMHESSTSQIQTDKTAYEKKIARFLGEQFAMYQKWLPALAKDPAYNSNFGLTGAGFKIEPIIDLTWRPLPWRPLPLVLVPRILRWNDGDRRVCNPLDAMRRLDILDGAVSPRLLHVVEVERLQPDAIVFQRPFSLAELPGIELIQKLTPAIRVMDIDRLPEDHRSDPLFLRSLTLMDRIVVSSSRIAHALEGMHTDIQVVPDYLPAEWKHVQGRRGVSEKPRVGWRGDHDALDLQLLSEIMPVLADEVDFVVMGWCPIELRPFVRDTKLQAAVADHPEALAAMNLDLALLPLLGNGLQGSQSVSRLLEFGACGFPVICSEIACDDDSLPVTRLSNVAQLWIDAIRLQIADKGALGLSGDALRLAVQGQWLLDEPNLHTWRSAWLR
ncbi:glycosyltransferase family 2 protein [Pseudomonas huanghezhanensis]|uniref:glycosyltransferase family 2 protein n=1 Tax=Pseudomonas huanghezhanensis TaxID=3002903 RepID=UPI002285B493|nr:glycosyltransferase [Pseudomonas sp. BSw22131]